MNTNDKRSIALIPLFLPLAVVLPYAFFLEKFRLLSWVWHTGYSPFWIFTGISVLAALLSSALVYRLYPQGLKIFYMGVALAIGHVSFLAMQERRHSLLVFIFAEFCLLIFIGEKIRKVLKRPYYDSRRRWWESYPKSLPNLKAYISHSAAGDAEPRPVRISNFSEDGCFIFSENSEIGFTPKLVEIRSNDSTLLISTVEVMEKTGDGLGMGLKFVGAGCAQDLDKDLKDNLRLLRRSGYVSS